MLVQVKILLSALANPLPSVPQQRNQQAEHQGSNIKGGAELSSTTWHSGSGGPLSGDESDELSEAARVGDDQRNFFYCMSRQAI